MKIILLLLGVWLFCLLVGVFVGYLAFDSPIERGLAKNGQTTSGTILSLEPENHAQINYSYKVEGREYLGEGHLSSFKELRVGQPVEVTYNRLTPNVSSLGEPSEDVANSQRTIIFVGIIFSVFPTALVALCVFVLRKASPKLPSNDQGQGY